MIVGFVLVLLAIAGGISMFAYIYRLRQCALRNQYLHRAVATRRTGSLDAPSYPAPLVQLRPVATQTPAAEDDGSLRECPICFDEITHNKEWLLLPCKHGVCTTCYHKLVQDQHRVTTCPLCRMPLLEPVPTPQPAIGPSPHPETCSRSCPWSSQHMLSSTQTASWLNTALPVGSASTSPHFVHFQHALSPNAVVLPV